MLWFGLLSLLVYLVLLGAFFYVMTTEVFVVKLNSGIWWFALLLFLICVILNLTVILHPTNYSFYVRVSVLVALAALTGVVAWLGIEYKPFQNIVISEKLGALFEGGSTINFDDLPPPLEEVTLDMPAPLNQGRCSSCWAYAGALILSSILYQPDRVSQRSCSEGADVKDWLVSPQALIDLDTVGKCRGSYTDQGLKLATRYSIPNAKCVPGYSSKFNGSTSSCTCNSPKTKFCLLSQSGAREHSKCSNPDITLKKNGSFRGREVSRIEPNVTNIKKALSFKGPVLVWISFYKEGPDPLWCLTDRNLFGGTGFSLPNANWVARPRDDKNYRIEYGAIGHALVIFGYGKNTDGVEYWICQNSWGKDWGYKGTIKIELGVNAWGIESDAHVIL